MKKILAAALALCMTMGAAALAEGTFRVGVKQDVYGFGYYDEATGEFSGMEIDLGEKLAEALGYDEVEYTAVTAATRGQMLDNDELDCVIATFTIKPERKESWDFSTPYYVDAVTVLVEDESGITDLAGLKDKTVGVSSGSTSAKALAKAMAEAGAIDAFDEDTFDAATFSGGVSFKIFDDYPAISMALDAGDVDAFCVDKSILANYTTDGRSFIADSFSPQEYGVEIVRCFAQSEPSQKGMILRVTDERLLEKTGGIVQGMSGSPILQDGRIIGAVTHVYLSDATQGYGMYIEWMLEKSDAMDASEQAV